MSQPLIRDISDTARWVAIYRARESERPDAVFRDPLARRLAGERGDQIARSMPFSEKNAWSFIARTWLFDRLIMDQVAQGIDLVVNLAAGLDTRPYRLPLPAQLRWVEVDHAPLLAYKEEALRSEQPVCQLQHVALDLADVAARRRLFADLGGSSRRALIVSEGLLIYLTDDEVGALAHDLATPPSFQRWIMDLASPALLRLLQRSLGVALDQAGVPLKFAPAAGLGFFERFGWKGLEVQTLLHAGARLRRVSWLLWVMAKLFPSQQFTANRPWGGVCLLGRA